MKLNRLVLGVPVLFALFAGEKAHGQDKRCPDALVYENHNQVDYGPLKLSTIEGQAIVDADGKSFVPGACLSLFSEASHEWKASVTADSEGKFLFSSVIAGRYRLIARGSGFCPANVPLIIIKPDQGKRLNDVKLVIHFRVWGIDRCSFGTLTPKQRKDKKP